SSNRGPRCVSLLDICREADKDRVYAHCVYSMSVIYQFLVVGILSASVCIRLPRAELCPRCAALSSPSSAPPLDLGTTWSAVHDQGLFQQKCSPSVQRSLHGPP